MKFVPVEESGLKKQNNNGKKKAYKYKIKTLKIIQI